MARVMTGADLFLLADAGLDLLRRDVERFREVSDPQAGDPGEVRDGPRLFVGGGAFLAHVKGFLIRWRQVAFAQRRDPVVGFSSGLHWANRLTMVEITVKLPDMLARTLGPTAEARAQRLTEAVAIEEYRAGRLSQRQVAEVLGLDYWQTESFMAERNVALNYSLADLEADRATLDEVLGRP